MTSASENQGLALRGVSRRFDGVTAVDAVDLDVAHGEIVAVLGPSGCGKSTLLRIVAGLERPDEGRVRWGGVDITDLAPHRRAIGLMFQDHVLFPHRDVGSNVGFGLEMARMPRQDRQARVHEVLSLVGLEHFVSRDVSTLSGGEAQRVALARALAPEPGLLLLDEPLGSLDRDHRERLAVELREVILDAGLTAVTVTHDHDEAFTVADRIAMMRDGRLVQVGPAAVLRNRPADDGVARFLGIDAIVDVEHRNGPTGGVLHTPWGPVATGDWPAACRRAAVLPEGLVVLEDPGAGAGEDRRLVVEATVTQARYRGDRFLLTVRTEEPPVDLLVASPRRHDRGDPVTVAVAADAFAPVGPLPPDKPPEIHVM